MAPDPDDERHEISDSNPYSIPETPSSELAPRSQDGQRRARGRIQDADLAGLGLRFVGNLIDSLPFIVIYTALMFLTAGPGGPTEFGEPWVPVAMLITTVVFLAVMTFLTATRSQSIGKFFLGTQIVLQSGQRAGFLRIVLLRNLLPAFIPCFSLIDPFFIFGRKRQCLHDMIASTYVVQYSSVRS